jgi:hypothetical protein
VRQNCGAESQVRIAGQNCKAESRKRVMGWEVQDGIAGTESQGRIIMCGIARQNNGQNHRAESQGRIAGQNCKAESRKRVMGVGSSG